MEYERKYVNIKNLLEVIEIHLRHGDRWYCLPRNSMFVHVNVPNCSFGNITPFTEEELKRLEELGWSGAPNVDVEQPNIIDLLRLDQQIIEEDIKEFTDGTYIARCFS